LRGEIATRYGVVGEEEEDKKVSKSECGDKIYFV